MPQPRGGSPFDDAFHALAHRDRRRLLVALLAHNPLAGILVPEELQDGEQELEDLYEGFYHRHLPVLDALGFIEWDRETHMVSEGPNFADIRPMVELLDEYRDDLFDGWI